MVLGKWITALLAYGLEVWVLGIVTTDLLASVLNVVSLEYWITALLASDSGFELVVLG